MFLDLVWLISWFGVTGCLVRAIFGISHPSDFWKLWNYLRFIRAISKFSKMHSSNLSQIVLPNMQLLVQIKHVLFTCNWFIVLRKWAHTCMLLQKSCFENISKFQQILTTAMESISRKGSFLQLLNVLWKRTLPQLFFYIATLISSKLWKCPVHGNSFSIYCSGEIFLFLWLYLMKGAVVQHSYIM